MKRLNDQRVRLRRELRQAYDLWMAASAWRASRPEPDRGLDVTGSPEAAKAQWLDYLAAKERLVRAYAEPSPAV